MGYIGSVQVFVTGERERELRSVIRADLAKPVSPSVSTSVREFICLSFSLYDLSPYLNYKLNTST